MAGWTNLTPSAAALASGSAYLYEDTGALKYQGTSGTPATIVAADGTLQAGGGGGNSFTNIAVAGQSTVVADSSTDTLTLVAGTNVTITTNATTDTVTINSTGGSSSNAFANVNVDGTVLAADSTSDTLFLVSGVGVTMTPIAGTDTVTFSATNNPHNQMCWKTGGYWYGPNYLGGAGTNTTTTATNGTLFFVPIVVPQFISIDRLTIEVTTIAASGTIRAGIYSSNYQGIPTTLVNDYGTISSATLGEKTWTISETLTTGIYWLAIAGQGSGSTGTRGTNVGLYQPFNAPSAYATVGAVMYTMTGVTGALPTTLTLTPSTAAIVHKLMVRTV